MTKEIAKLWATKLRLGAPLHYDAFLLKNDKSWNTYIDGEFAFIYKRDLIIFKPKILYKTEYAGIQNVGSGWPKMLIELLESYDPDATISE